MLSSKGYLVAVITLLLIISSFAAKMSCTDCKVIASALQTSFSKPKTNKPTADPSLIDEGTVGPGRRGRHRLSEIDIFNHLDTVCEDKVSKLRPNIVSSCREFIKKEKDLLESYIFQQGVDRLVVFTCATLSEICTPHDIIDSGEL
jgi:hypothetical protein